MTPEEFANITPRQFYNRLNGWREIRQADGLEAWRRTRTHIQYTLQTVAWKSGRPPDMLQLMPLPGDPVKEPPKDMNADTPENARRWYKTGKARQVKWPKWRQDIIDKHYIPEWDK